MDDDIPTWGELHERLKRVAQNPQSKVALARVLKVKLPAVYQFVKGECEPRASKAFQLFKWVKQMEAKQSETPPVLDTRTGRKTRKLNQANEKDKRVRKNQ